MLASTLLNRLELLDQLRARILRRHRAGERVPRILVEDQPRRCYRRSVVAALERPHQCGLRLLAERRVFQGFTQNIAKNAMARACKAAGIVHRHPHDLRQRYALMKIMEGVPVTTVAAQLGHSRKSLTLDTYSHVLVDE